MRMKFESVYELIKQRQSLFTSQMVEGALIPDENIWKLLDLANYAPSHRRTEPWRFKVYSRSPLVELYKKIASIYWETTSSELFEERKLHKIASKSDSLSHAIVICMHRNEKQIVPAYEEEYAVACAVQNMLLGMKSLNIIGYWSTPKMCFTEEFHRFLNLTGKDKCMGILQLGVKKPNLPEIPKPLNGAIKEKVEWFD